MTAVKFQFRLQRVLDIRKKKEEERERELAQLKTLLIQAEEFLDELKEESFKISERMGYMQGGQQSLNMEELLLYYDYLEHLRNNILYQIQTIKDIIVNIERKREELIEASKERKIIEKLKENQYQKFKECVERWETKLIDEMGTVNFNYRKDT